MRTLALSAALAVAVLALSPAATAQNRATPVPAAPLACADFNGHVNHAWRLANPASLAQPERSRLAELAAGARIGLQAPAGGLNQRYLGLRYIIGTATTTAGTITAGLVEDLDLSNAINDVV